MKRLNFWNAVMALTLMLLIVFLAVPFFQLFANSFFTPDGSTFTFGNYERFFNVAYYMTGLKRSLLTSGIVMVLAVLIGVPMAYATSRFNVFGKKALTVMVIMSLMSPPFIGAYSWILLLGRNGVITNFFKPFGIELPTIYGFKGIILVLTLNLFPHVYLFVSGALKGIDVSLEEAAQNLGTSRFKRFFKITLPLIFPTIASSALLVFMTAIAGLGTPMLIGEGYKVLPLMIYEEFINDMGGNPAIASTISVILVLITSIMLILQKYIVSRKNYNMSALRPAPEEQLRPLPRVLVSLACFLLAFVSLLPQIVVVITSFVKTNGPLFVNGFSFDSYRTIFSKLATPIKNTFSYATITIVVIIIMGMLISYVIARNKSKLSSFLDVVLMIPYVMPGAVLAIAFLSTFNRPPLFWGGTAIILIVTFIIRKLPYTIRSSTAILHQIDPSVEEASISLGCPPAKTFFKITGVLMIPGVLSGAILSWVTTINELSSSMILYSGKTTTIAVAIYTEVLRGSFGTAAALGTILSLCTLLSIMLVFKLTGEKGFRM